MMRMRMKKNGVFLCQIELFLRLMPHESKKRLEVEAKAFWLFRLRKMAFPIVREIQSS